MIQEPPAPPPQPAPDPIKSLGVALEPLRGIAESTRTTEELLKQSIAGQERIVETLFLPVVPTRYDKDGRIIEARRREET